MTQPGGMPLPDNLPSSSAMQGIMDELSDAMERIPQTQEQLMSLTGVAWSDDKLVKAVVGPRGQLVDLEIDPKAFRKPDAQALKSSILQAVATAVREVTTNAHEIVSSQLPPELAEMRQQFNPGGEDALEQLLMTDADILAAREEKADDDA